MTCHKIDPPFLKGTNNEYIMQHSNMHTHFLSKYLARVMLLDHYHAIFKDRGPKECYVQIFLGNGYPRKLTTT